MCFVKRFCFQQSRLIRTFAGRISDQERIYLRVERRSIGIVKIDQPLILRVFRFLPVRIFRDNFAVDLFSLLRMPELPLAVPDQKHHFCARLLRDLILRALVLGQQLSVLRGLILQAQQPGLRNPTPLSCFRNRLRLLQKTSGLFRQRLVGLSLFVALEIDGDQTSTNRCLCF